MKEKSSLLVASMKRRFWRFVHNVVAHPLMEIIPEKMGDDLHDWTAKLAFIKQ